MSIIYVSDPETKLGAEGNRLVAVYGDGTKHTILHINLREETETDFCKAL